MEDYIFIIFLIIFFAGPLLKKMLEGGSSSSSARSRENIKEYLERMRALHEKQQPLSKISYQNAEQADIEQNKQSKYKYNQSRETERNFQAIEERSVISDNVRHDIEQHLSDHMGDDINTHVKSYMDENIHEHVYQHLGENKTVVQSKQTQKVLANLRKKILSNSQYDDLQKAMILHEIFSSPVTLSRKK